MTDLAARSSVQKILIVEDNELIAEAFETALGEMNFDVAVARDGVDAIEKIIANSPDSIILDLVLPKKDGFEVLEEIKENEDIRPMNVIVLSNLETNEYILKAKELGVNKYFIKSNFSIAQVLDAITGHTSVAGAK